MLISDQIHAQAILRPKNENKYIQPSLFKGVGSNMPREKRPPVNNWLLPPTPTKYFIFSVFFFAEAMHWKLFLFFLKLLEHGAVWLEELVQLSNSFDVPTYGVGRVAQSV